MSLHSLIFENVWLKVTSLLLATLVWFVVNANFAYPDARMEDSGQNLLAPGFVRNLKCPVTVVTEAGDRRFFEVTPVEVAIRARGDVELVRKLTPESIHVQVRLSRNAASQGYFPLDVDPPPGIKVEVWPAQVQVRAIEVKPAEDPASRP